MITALSICIVIISSFIVYFLIKLDEKVVSFHEKVIGDVIKLTEDIKDIRKSIHKVNKIVRVITNPKYINMYKMATKTLDVAGIILFLVSLKDKKTRFKKLLSTKFLKHAYSLYKTLTA